MRFRGMIGMLLVSALLQTAALAADCGGRLVRVSDGRTITFDAMAAGVSKAEVVAVGERHGLREHVGAASCLLKALGRKQDFAGRTSLVVEHIASEKQPLIEAYRREHPEDASGLGEALQWSKSGWPAWPVYEPLYAAAFAGRHPVYGSDWKKGTPPPSEDDLASRLGGADASHVVRTWAGLMNEAHCGTLDEARSLVFARAQTGRDLAMAGVVQSELSKGNRVLFYSGRSHSRKDISVPFIVGAGAKVRVASISLQETSIGKTRVSRKEVLKEAGGRYDYVWFIGKAPKEDVCAVFRKKSGEKQKLQ